jgi:CRISPR/Cas system-associated exonuclease Cas4 (RecB family)
MPHVESFIDGVWYPSVSTIIGATPKPWLQAWRDKWGDLATRKMEIAAAVGTAFHDCVEQYLDTGGFTVRIDKYASCVPRVMGMMESFIEWALSIDGIIEHTEMKVISKLYRYSGTFDAIGVIEGTDVILDWKTGSKIYPEMDLQLAAYAQAYKEEKGTNIKHGVIVHVSKDKPRYKVTVKGFKLGKRVLNKFLVLREMFDDVKAVVQ